MNLTEESLPQGKIWRNPKIKVFYYNRPSLYKFLIKQLYVEAPYNPYL